VQSSVQEPGWSESDRPTATRVEDPLRFCVFTTLALLAWLLGPVIVALLGGLGLLAYVRAWRGGLRRSRCFLRDTRLAIAYLAAAFGVGAVFTIQLLLRRLG